MAPRLSCLSVHFQKGRQLRLELLNAELSPPLISGGVVVVEVTVKECINYLLLDASMTCSLSVLLIL